MWAASSFWMFRTKRWNYWPGQPFMNGTDVGMTHSVRGWGGEWAAPWNRPYYITMFRQFI